uniref:Integrase catalytic domain-containing protein n=1 Tax=Graphocephala atropunctata TaxID=36148 RepID=A0A1B6KZV2_9HEMI
MAPKEFKYETYRKVTDLIKGRFASLNASVTKITSSDQPLTAVQIRQLNTFFAELKKKRADFEVNLQRVIESEQKEATEAILSKDQDDINDLYVEISSAIEVNVTPEPVSPQSTRSETSVQFPTAVISGVKLPKLNLQTYDGSPLKWISFINLFDTTVHRNATLSNVAKFQYLLSVLEGEPLNLVKSLNLTAANYQIAYQLLRDRYHNTRRLTTLHLNHLLDMPSVPPSNSKQMRSFITTFYEHSESLKALECDITEDNPLLAAHLLRKLDNKTVQRLEQHRDTSNRDDREAHSLPKVMEIINFLNLECSHIEDANLHSSPESKPHSSSAKPKFEKRVQFAPRNVTMLSSETKIASQNDISCFCCHKSGHKIYQCPVFKGNSPNDRYKIVKDNQRCVSCLGTHSIKECKSKNSCMTCHKKHHSLLHFNTPQGTAFNASASMPLSNADTSLTCAAQPKTVQHSTVLLSTTLVKLTANNGCSYVFRALLDSGSMSDFVSERAAQLLGTRRLPSNLTVMGLSQNLAYTKGSMNLNIDSLSGHSIAQHHSFHVLDKISVDLPRVELSPEVLKRVKPFVLADPTFHKPGPIDVLLGSSIFPQVMSNECYSLGPNMPYALGTTFGFVIVGTAPCSPLPPSRVSNLAISLLSTDTELHSSLQRFWTQEELPAHNKKSEEELVCDTFFDDTHTRDSQGRYVVRLPFSSSIALNKLGTSKNMAEQRFQSLENKLQNPKNSELCSLYSDFMSEYLSLGHMELCSKPVLNTPHFYLPHHGVFKTTNNTTKLRVVFDASSKTSSGQSLNDVLLTGPKLQNNICDILLHFRVKPFVFSCDIRQMYRQIKVHPYDQRYQLILWRDEPSLPLSTYQLTTVTYGMNCSPYLAIKTLHQLAEDEGTNFPQAAEILKHHSYVDDLIVGASTEQEALELKAQLIQLLSLGGFELRKWVSNCPNLLQDLPPAHQESPVFLQPSSDPLFSILGIHWSPVTDCFKYDFNFSCDAPTKRQVLSLIARIYDPCGFLSPCIMTAKRLMQLLWTSGVSWDEPLNSELSLQWNDFVKDLTAITELSIPRAVMLPHVSACELIGFSDASEAGYAAVVYLRCVNSDNDVRITQIISKTRAAPLKKVTLPRLELCAAHLLAQLVSYVNTQYENVLTIDSITLWCDSTVALSWIHTLPYRLKTYVANRVAQIQELLPSHCWRHVSGSDNPADCASRGLRPSELVHHPLWWQGPAWLQLPAPEWPASSFSPIDLQSLDEVKSTPLSVFIATPQPQWDLLSRFSSWKTLLHVMAYLLRFASHSRRQENHQGPLSVAELQAAQLRIFKVVQQDVFADDIAALRNNKTCSTRLQRLAPFLDADGLLRVGGRLKHSELSDEARHPCLLPKTHHVTDLFIDHIHLQHLHSGVQLTMSLLAQYVWILSARTTVRSRIFKCMVCFKLRPKPVFPLMGDLPKARVTPARPFMSTGIDYGGPFTIKVHNLRSIRHIKAYICIFICLVTKAVHIEVATDLSTDSFIAALTRFVSRRGFCSDIYSDCGTNFVGAKNALKDIVHTISKRSINQFSSDHNINFHFNPPAAPHQGGLWESAIKSAKHHLKRVLGNYVPTLMQFSTLTCQVEAMLNSRPLTSLSTDPNDLQALTPGHFLIGAPLASLPELPLSEVPDNRLTLWQLTQAFSQRIWKRWNRDYLHTLQQRLKWDKPTRNLQVGDLVIIHQDTPSLMWPLARITKVTKGSDNVVRVVELKTPHGNLTRPAVKVFLLPFLATSH